MTGKVNLAAKLASFSEHFSPRIVADLNNYKIEVVKAKGEFVWHTHPDTDAQRAASPGPSSSTMPIFFEKRVVPPAPTARAAT